MSALLSSLFCREIESRKTSEFGVPAQTDLWAVGMFHFLKEVYVSETRETDETTETSETDETSETLARAARCQALKARHSR
ncbi:MAG: hypothetical protein KF762_04885 [Acidobacteria bacterium]|nr:hypothetical protein [Acidobacteriota bacterium]